MAQPSKYKKNKSRIISTVILISILIAAVAGGIVLILFVKKEKKMDLTMAYSTTELIYTNAIDSDMQMAKSFANTLCVGADNTGHDGISLDNGEIGGLFSMDDRTILFANGIYGKIYPASITKVMTAILACKYGNMDDVVTITWEDLELESGSQVCGFKIGDQVRMSELLHGLLIHSGNDAAMAIARHVGGTVSKFVTMMNEETAKIGATGTNFINPSGLHDENHYTTVYDIYLMLNEALNYPDFVSVMQISVYDLTYTAADGTEQHITLDSTDHYLTKEISAPKNVTVLGGKTGTTSIAGSCLALVSQNAYGKPYVSIVVRAQNKDILYEKMNSMLSQINA